MNTEGLYRAINDKCLGPAVASKDGVRSFVRGLYESCAWPIAAVGCTELLLNPTR